MFITRTPELEIVNIPLTPLLSSPKTAKKKFPSTLKKIVAACLLTIGTVGIQGACGYWGGVFNLC